MMLISPFRFGAFLRPRPHNSADEVQRPENNPTIFAGDQMGGYAS